MPEAIDCFLAVSENQDTPYCFESSLKAAEMMKVCLLGIGRGPLGAVCGVLMDLAMVLDMDLDVVLRYGPGCGS